MMIRASMLTDNPCDASKSMIFWSARLMEKSPSFTWIQVRAAAHHNFTVKQSLAASMIHVALQTGPEQNLGHLIQIENVAIGT